MPSEHGIRGPTLPPDPPPRILPVLVMPPVPPVCVGNPHAPICPSPVPPNRLAMRAAHPACPRDVSLLSLSATLRWQSSCTGRSFSCPPKPPGDARAPGIRRRRPRLFRALRCDRTRGRSGAAIGIAAGDSRRSDSRLAICAAIGLAAGQARPRSVSRPIFRPLPGDRCPVECSAPCAAI